MMALELVPESQGASLEAVAAGSMRRPGSRASAARARASTASRPTWACTTADAGRRGRARQAAHIRLERQVLLLAGIASQSRYAQAERLFADAIRSFAPLDAAEAARIKPDRLGFTTVRSGDTWQRIAERTGGLIPASDLAVLNGFAANSQPPAGQRIKIVIAGE